MKSILTIVFFLPIFARGQDSSYKFGKFEGFVIARHIAYVDSLYRPNFIFLVPLKNNDTSFCHTTIWSGLWGGGEKSNYSIENFFDTTINVRIPKLAEAKIIPKRVSKKYSQTINEIKNDYTNKGSLKFDIYYVRAKIIYKKILVDKDIFEDDLNTGNYISRYNISMPGNYKTLCNYSFLYYFKKFYRIR